tara:strand:+ start:2923 stop:3489 length:567 start_codon:yes stop_codon:yes gene_type:complete
MHAVLIKAFMEEMEKVSAGPHMIEADDVFQGLYMRRGDFDRQMQEKPQVRAILQRNHPQIFSNTKKDVVFTPSRAALRRMGIPEENIEATWKGARRHELAHWMRNRRGKMGEYGKPGLLNKLRTFREEAVAWKATPPTRGGDFQRKMVKAHWPEFAVQSTQAAYPNSPKITSVGGKAIKALRAVKVIR